ncbi:hypothetical protein [Aliikangiella coralliicola]|uniref:Uncharacterized protein n=1 Tax=Aliikangiella coralliicola TaxID=2592383 RepID=A0A545UDT0_9GAMM|nr:hypothetical protein [Aliikangiella coralliicola]TQV87627.1 hypothetical protein FLL46_12210 [Aliikangiella coralliicola]
MMMSPYVTQFNLLCQVSLCIQYYSHSKVDAAYPGATQTWQIITREISMYCKLNRHLFVISLFVFLSAFSLDSDATETRLVVYVMAQDAKFIGDFTGGAQVVIKHRETGEILSRGITSGGTGNTEQIINAESMQQTISSDAAFYLARLSIKQPTPISIEVSAPMNFPQSIHQQSLSRWLFPGVEDTPVFVKLAGYIVEGQFELTKNKFNLNDAQLNISARVRMLCGCALSRDGIWRSDNANVWAEINQGPDKLASFDLGYRDESRFSGVIDIRSLKVTDKTRLTIYARSKDGQHTGRWSALISEALKNNRKEIYE